MRLADPYFLQVLANVDHEPSTQAISKLEFEFERRKLAKDDVWELTYREILEYHPQMLQEYLHGREQTSFMYPRPSVLSSFQRRVPVPKDETAEKNIDFERRTAASVATTLNSPPKADGEKTLAVVPIVC
ncbi:hypothetical protein Dsin_009898 [Dipteronia sinensis]|uniref:Uncharacterized protein n=1 Tax=Dipteronia sinensis TaxID=43782 RepID=A0AAE0ART6_9ROSI|nr:hypothetical protein Dsin_009898 [Dipteronia sinensis]